MLAALVRDRSCGDQQRGAEPQRCPAGLVGVLGACMGLGVDAV